MAAAGSHEPIVQWQVTGPLPHSALSCHSPWCYSLSDEPSSRIVGRWGCGEGNALGSAVPWCFCYKDNAVIQGPLHQGQLPRQAADRKQPAPQTASPSLSWTSWDKLVPGLTGQSHPGIIFFLFVLHWRIPVRCTDRLMTQRPGIALASTCHQPCSLYPTDRAPSPGHPWVPTSLLCVQRLPCLPWWLEEGRCMSRGHWPWATLLCFGAAVSIFNFAASPSKEPPSLLN